MKITPVNDNFLIEPILRTKAQTEEMRKRASKVGLLVAETKTDNRETFEGIPNQGYIRYLPEAYKGGLTVGTRIVFNSDKPNGIHFEDEKLIALKADQILAVIVEDE